MNTGPATRRQEVVHELAVALRTASLYDRGNQTVLGAAERLLAALDAVPDAETTLTVRNRTVFVDDERVRVVASEFLDFRTLTSIMEAWGIGELTFLPGLHTAELVTTLTLLTEDPDEDPRLLERLQQHQVVHVEVGEGAPEPEASRAQGDGPLRTYAACLDVCHEMHEAVRDHRQIRTRRLRRVTQAVVDQVLRDEQALLAMTTIKEFDHYLFSHSANVAIISVAVGTRLGLDKPRLGELCLAAFLHDVGKLRIPLEILDKDGPLDEQEWGTVRQHPHQAVHVLLEQRQLTRSVMRAVVAGFEHHLNHDLSGYPPLSLKTGITLFGRIITIADRYDAMTTPRAYRRRNLTPYEGVQYLTANVGTLFDPLLVRVFVETVGQYPPGTVVGLENGDVGIVQRPPLPGSPIDRPLVGIIRGASPGSAVDLAGTGAGGTRPPAIRTVYNPDNAGLLPAPLPGEGWSA